MQKERTVHHIPHESLGTHGNFL